MLLHVWSELDISIVPPLYLVVLLTVRLQYNTTSACICVRYDVNFTPTAGMSETKNNNIMCNYQRVVSSTNLINILLSTPKQKRAL